MSSDNKVSSLLPFLSSPRLLAGESEAEFQSGLQSLLSELDSPSTLAIALITQLNECLLWQAIMHLKQSGLRWLDRGGISEEHTSSIAA